MSITVADILIVLHASNFIHELKRIFVRVKLNILIGWDIL